MPRSTSCLYSTVKNTSGKTKRFGFLPPHGRQLASGEEFTVFGDVREAIIRYERTEARRNIIALENALQHDQLEILETPNPIFRDENNLDHSYMVELRQGTLGLVDPCWNASESDPPIG